VRVFFCDDVHVCPCVFVVAGAHVCMRVCAGMPCVDRGPPRRYDASVQAKIGFFDDNTQSWWSPVTGCVPTGHPRGRVCVQSVLRLLACLRGAINQVQCAVWAPDRTSGRCRAACGIGLVVRPLPSLCVLIALPPTPQCSGANVPALNDLLAAFGIAFGGTVYSGNIDASAALTMDGDAALRFASGVAIARFPEGGVRAGSLPVPVPASWRVHVFVRACV
jgi:hypothetical protein